MRSAPCAAAVLHHLGIRRHPAIFGPAQAALAPRRRAALWGHLLLHWKCHATAFYAFLAVPLRRPPPRKAPPRRGPGRPPGPNLAALYARLDDLVALLRASGLHTGRIRLLSALVWHLPADTVREAAERARGIEAPAPLRLRPQTLAAYQKQILVDALWRHRGNVTSAAVELGVSRRSIYNWMERYGIARTYGIARIAQTDAAPLPDAHEVVRVT